MIGSADKKFSSGVVLTLAARILMAFNSVAAGAVIARLLGAGELGIYLILSSTAQMLVQSASFSLHIGNTFYTARERDRIGAATTNSLLFAFAVGVPLIAIVIALSDRLLPGINSDLVIVVLLSVPFQVVTGFLINLFLVQGEVRRFNLIDLVNQSFIFINAILVLIVLGWGLRPLVSANTIAAVLVSAAAATWFYLITSKKQANLNWKPDLALLQYVVKYSAKGFVLWIATFVVYRIDLVVLNYFRGSTESAPYAVAAQCSMFLLLLPHAVSHLLQARVASADDDKGAFTAKTARNTSIALFAACLVSVPGVFLVVVIYGDAFSSLPLLLWILLPGVYFVGMQSVIAQYFVGTGLPISLPIVWVGVLALNIVGNIISIPSYGAVGAAAVSTICYLIAFIAVAAMFVKRTDRTFSELIVPNFAELMEAIAKR